MSSAEMVRSGRGLRTVCLAIVAGLLTVGSPAWATGLVPVTDFGSNPGDLLAFEHSPPNAPPCAPLVVVLHGCTIDAAWMDQHGDWNRLADRYGFHVLYPQQKKSNNSMLAFNWFEEGDIVRGKGEARSIKEMIDWMKARHDVDPDRVFVTGLSAGACMAVVMAAVYPEVISGASIMAGLPYRAATTPSEGVTAMFMGKDLSPKQWGDLVRGQQPQYAGSYARVVVFHGTADRVVKPMLATEVAEQWADLHGLGAGSTTTDLVAGHQHVTYRDAGGRSTVEIYRLKDMPHGIAVDPGPGPDQGGQTDQFAHAVGLFSSLSTLKFWGLAPATR